MLSAVMLLSAVFAGLVAIGSTVAIERWGGRVGGLLATLPTTIVPASLGIHAASEDVLVFQAALLTTPAGLLVDALFLASWRFLPRYFTRGSTLRRLLLVLSGSLVLWLLAALLVVAGIDALRRVGVPMLVIGLSSLVAIVGSGVVFCRATPSAPGASRQVGLATLLARGLLAGVAIAGAVGLATHGGPLAAGVAAVFPAIFLTTMVSLWLSQGPSVPEGAVGPMMLGSSSVAAFAILAAVLMPILGPAQGGACAWFAAALGFTCPAWWWLRSQPPVSRDSPTR